MPAIDLSHLGGLDDLKKAIQDVENESTDPTSVSLKNWAPKAYPGPEPTVTLSYSQYPHIIENIVKQADSRALLVLRTTCKNVCELVDREYARHIVLRADRHRHNLQFTSRELGRIPSFRFRGPISLRIGVVPDTPKPEEVSVIDQEGAEGTSPRHDLCLKIRPDSASWLVDFMLDVKNVDVVGATSIELSVATSSGQADPLGRCGVIGRFPVQLIRMYPDSNGAYASWLPFQSPHIVHEVLLNDPRRPINKTWLHTSPRIPDETTELALTIHIHPDLPSDVLEYVPLVYRPNLKSVIVTLVIVPDADGKTRATPNSFEALSSLWFKLFTNFRPGIRFFIHHIHQWDQSVGANLTRFRVATALYILWHQAVIPPGMSPKEVSIHCHPHLKFLREAPQFGMENRIYRSFVVNPDGSWRLNPDGSRAMVEE